MRSLKIFAAAFLFAACFSAQAQAGERFPVGLLFSEKDLPQIKANLQSEVFAGTWKRMLEADPSRDLRFLDSLKPAPDVQGLGRVEGILRRESFIYAMTGEASHLDLARKAIQRLVEFPRWDIFYDGEGRTLAIQEGSGATMSAAYAFDWLYDGLSEAEKAALLKAIADKGCEACFRTLFDMRHPENAKDWRADHFDLDLSRWPVILDRTNLKGLVIGGLGMGALALLNRDGRAARYLEMAEFSARRFLELYRSDGFYPEGSGYWEYSSEHVYPFIFALSRVTGTDLANCVNLRGAAEGWLSIQMPCNNNSRAVVNFGDNGRAISSGPALFIARTFRDGLAQYAALNFSRGHDIHSMIFYDPTITPEPPTEAQNYKLLGREWLVARTGFGVQDIVLAMRSGGPFNHEHSDRNSLIFKAFGERLLFDMDHPSYDRRDPTWALRQTAGHNCILVDGRGMAYHDGSEGTNDSRDSAFVLAEGRRDNYFFWVSDATPAYRRVDPDVRSVVRTVVASLEVPCLAVLDRVEKNLYGSRVSAMWQVDNSDGKGRAECSGTRFTIVRPEASLYCEVASASPVTLEAAEHPISGAARPYPFVKAACTEQSRGHLLITVMAPARNGSPAPELKITRQQQAPDKWEIRVRNGKNRWEMVVTDSGRVPLFEVKH